MQFRLFAPLLLLALSWAPGVRAEAPPPTDTQVPGVYRQQIGDLRVTALKVTVQDGG